MEIPSDAKTLWNDSEEISSDQTGNTSGGINISEEEQRRIKEGIKNFFYTSNEYLSTDFSLKRLCEIVKSNRFYVSYVINNVLNTSFHALVNEYRINEAKIRLLDNAQYGHLTIESIAESVGYKSRSNFARNFKATTGLTPSEFIAIAKASNQTPHQ